MIIFINIKQIVIPIFRLVKKKFILFSRAIYPFIIGQRGATKKRFETETKTTIQVPKQGEDGDISKNFNKAGITAVQ